MRDEREPVPWHYADVVRRHLSPSDEVLDVGTGGGERFLALAPHFHRGVGIDHDPAMIEQARKNKADQQVDNVDFVLMDGHRLNFPDEAERWKRNIAHVRSTLSSIEAVAEMEAFAKLRLVLRRAFGNAVEVIFNIWPR